MASIAVLGLGSIGTIYAAHLIAAGRHRVIACVRTAVESLRVEGDYGVIEAKPKCVTEPGSAEPVDFVFLATKAQDTAGAAEWLKHLCHAGTKVCVLQNGVDQEQRVEAYCCPAAVVPAVVYTNGRKIARQNVRHLCPGGDLVVPAGEAGDVVVELFEGALLKVRTSEDFITESWRKFLANVVANPLTALTNRNIEVFREGEMEQLALGLLREAALVGRAMGAKFTDDTPEQMLQWMARYPGETGTSMLQDRRDGKPLEIEALTGTLIRLGEEVQIATPLNRTIRAILSSIH